MDLHANTFFVNNLGNLLKGTKAARKHKFLLDWMLDNKVEVVDFVTLDGSTLPGRIVRNGLRHIFFRKQEAKYVLKKNGYLGVEIISDQKQLRDDDIIVYYSHFYNSQWEEKICKGIKVVDFLHFYGDKRMADILSTMKWDYYLFEKDLTDCPIFKKNYSWFKAKYVRRDFSYQPRFDSVVNFDNRKNKALAIGTITTCDDADFKSIYGSIIYQPKRQMLYENADKMTDVIDSLISPYEEKELKKIDEKSIVRNFFAKLYNYLNSGKQKSYFSFDIVKKFNEYQMFICPEDAIGSYGISTLEGMACGCACISDQDDIMRELGFEAGRSYISYDGTVQGLKDVINYFQQSDMRDKLRNIAFEGYHNVKKNFSSDVVARRYYENFMKMCQ